MYLPFHLVNPTAVEGIDTSDYTRPEQVDAAVQALKQHAVPLMITRGPIEGPVSESDHSGPFRDYVLGNYRVTRTFPNGDRVWEKARNLSDRLKQSGRARAQRIDAFLRIAEPKLKRVPTQGGRIVSN